MSSAQMTAQERRAAYSLSAIFGLRMLGLFMIFPVFALYAEQLSGVTPTLVGLAIGVYGLTQALLQIPFGMLSDRIGRKPVITAGLLIFAVGSVVAAMADSIYGVILGRALQGSGAIAAAIMALAADLTREEHRTKAMAVIGISIGMAFLLAMVAGPLLDGWIGVPGIFWLIACLALAGIAILHLAVPTPAHSSLHRDAETVPEQFRRVLGDGQLLRLDFGILVLHLVLTASFVVVPLALHDAGLPTDSRALFYLPVMVLAMAAMVPFVIIAEKRRQMKAVVVGAIITLGLAELGLSLVLHSYLLLAVFLWLFFTAFNLLEATLPSLIAKFAPADAKGTAMGVYSSSQFVGAFLGGLLGGWLHGAHGLGAVFLACAGLIALWALLGLSMQRPPYLSTTLLAVGRLEAEAASELEAALRRVPGVAEAVVEGDEGVAYLKVDNQRLDHAALEALGAAKA